MDGLKPQSQSIETQVSLEQRFSNGDAGAFDEVVARFAPMIQQLVCRLLGWSWDVDDVVQDVFAAALSNRKKFKGSSTLKTWLFAIAINQCRARHRKNMLWHRFLNRHADDKIHKNDPANELLQQEKISNVQKAVRQLPGKYRDVIVLKYLQELSTPEILEIMKMRESAFYTQLSRAKKMMHTELQSYMENDNE